MGNFSSSSKVLIKLREMGRLISAARRAGGLTQTALAERADTSRPTIVRIESGSAKVAWGTVMTVCWLLDLPSDPELMDPAHRAALLAGTANTHRARTRQELNDDF